MDTVIREIEPSEIAFLDDMLYEAIFIPDNASKPTRDIIYQPELYVYISNFGRPNDICYVALVEGVLIGAIWTRIFDDAEKGYGYIDSFTPELSMAVLEQFRHKGVGTLLIETMLGRLNVENYKQVSLSVDKQNYAFNFYLKYGFEIYAEDEKSAIMIRKLHY